MTGASHGQVLYAATGACGEIVMSNPTRRNAVSAHMWRALGEAVERAEADPEVACVILRGHGDHFAAGADISEFEAVYRSADSALAYTQTMLASLARLERCAKPTAAMIRGSCVGGGVSIALACDLRFADATARFAVTPGKLGLVYSLADTRRLIARVGASRALDLLLTARTIDAGEAAAIGLCDHLVAPEALTPAIEAFAGAIHATSPWSARATKAMVAMALAGREDDCDDAVRLLVEGFTGEDFREGYKAFLDKRAPTFRKPQPGDAGEGTEGE